MDPAQIPPVKQVDSIPFRKTGPKRNFLELKLTEIMRQKKGNPIIEASFKLRSHLRDEQPIPYLVTELNDEGHGVIWINQKTEKDKVKPLLEELFKNEEFNINPDHAKVIAWRNKTIDYMNNVIREILYGKNPDRYMVGEKLVMRKPYFKQDGRGYWKIAMNTSDEFTVTAVAVETRVQGEDSYRLNMKMYKLNIEYISDDLLRRDTLNIVHPESEGAYEALLKKVRDRAIETKISADWVTYYNILKWSANVIYNYALTAHKA